MLNDDFIIPTFLIAGFTSLLSLFLGVLIGLKCHDTDYKYKQTYCPKIYQKTDQYIQCMDKPFDDTLKVILTKK